VGAVLVASNSFPFADGDLGHVVNLGSTPQAGDFDVIAVISVTVIESVSAFGTVVDSHLDADHFQTYARQCTGAEAATFTVDTSGNHNTIVFWQRWRGLSALDKHAMAAGGGGVNAVATSSSGTLAASGEVAVAFASASATFSANQAGSWGGSYTETNETHQGSTVLGVYGAGGYKIGVGTAAENPTYTWTGDACTNATGAILTFTVATGETLGAGGSTAAAGGSVAVAAAQTVAAGGSTAAPGGSVAIGPQGALGVSGNTAAPGGHVAIVGGATASLSGYSRDLAAWFTGTVTVERFAGQTAHGPTYLAGTVEACFIDQGNTMVRAPNGDQVVSSARVFLPANTDTIPLGSKVTMPAAYGGARATVLTVQLRKAPGLPVPEHLEVALA
jgi:hypothetical protein